MGKRGHNEQWSILWCRRTRLQTQFAGRYTDNVQQTELWLHRRRESHKANEHLHAFCDLRSGLRHIFDDYAAAWLAVENGTLTYSTEGKEDIDYYYINGNGSIANVVEQWTALVGRQQLPPVWALGYITSKYGYKTEAETRSVIDSLKRGGYPLDGVVLDLYWYGKEEDMGRLAWDADQWPDHKGMLRDFKNVVSTL